VEGQVWHPQCLVCIECKKKLAGSNFGAFVGVENKAYCKIHYTRLIQSNPSIATMPKDPSKKPITKG